VFSRKWEQFALTETDEPSYPLAQWQEVLRALPDLQPPKQLLQIFVARQKSISEVSDHQQSALRSGKKKVISPRNLFDIFRSNLFSSFTAFFATACRNTSRLRLQIDDRSEEDIPPKQFVNRRS